WLFDPGDELEIIESEIPYTLQNDANSVVYEPCPYYFDGTDLFTYKVNDGGSDPNGGDSNIADVNIVMDMLSDVVFEEDVNTNNDYIPLKTDSKKLRCQAIYHADELGSISINISSLALKIKDAPPIEIQNWKIRMKHTTESSFATGVLPFENDGWTDVYNANETITIEDDWHEFVLNVAFEYNGADNLIIDFSFDSSINSPGLQGKVYDSERTERRIIANWHDSVMPVNSISHDWGNRVFNLKLKSQPDIDVLYSDFNYNCSVGMEDFLTMIDTWLAQTGDANFKQTLTATVI
ncbi:MAG: hypothetical protein ACYSUG_07585, partial [Planctomycetota bacterium]